MKKSDSSNMIRVAVVGSEGSGKSTFCAQANELATTVLPERPIEWIDVDDPEELPRIAPNVILQVVDSTDLEESLVLTPQLIDMHQKLVLVLNHYDRLLATGHSINYDKLGHLMGVQIATCNAVSGTGLDVVLRMVLDAFDDKENTSRHIHVEYGTDIEEAIDDIIAEVARIPGITDRYSKRYISIRLLERTDAALEMLQDAHNVAELAALAERHKRNLKRELGHPVSEMIHEARHGFIHGALNETLRHSDDDSDHTRQQKIDAVLTGKWFGFPILVAVLFLVFECTFALGAYPQMLIENGIHVFGLYLTSVLPNTWYTSLLVDGILQGIGAVLAFLPNIIILFFFISLLEDSGYMARVAFLMDKIMHKVGLHGRSFVPMLVGFGCNVPAIMAARSINNKKDRTLTMLMIPFMSCGARLPVYMLFVGAFFQKQQALVMMSLYLIGIVLSILFALIMKRSKYFRKPTEDYVSELPAFRKPTFRNTGAHIWERCADYLKKISTVILWASIAIWALYYFPKNQEIEKCEKEISAIEWQMKTSRTAVDHNLLSTKIDSLQSEKLRQQNIQKENSFLAGIGKWMEPVMRPLGFDWRMNVCILTGIPAKENIVSTMGILFHQDDERELEQSISENPFFSPLKAYAFMLFVLLYFPCVATIATLRREIGRGWAAFTAVNSMLLAWLVAFAVFQIGSLFL